MSSFNLQIPSLKELLTLTKVEQQRQLQPINEWLEQQNAVDRIIWAFEHLEGEHALSSSFGIQAALMLHLVNQVKANTIVILTDTGALFPETYRFIDQLTEQLNLNLKVYRSPLSSSWQEARYGKLWLQNIEGIELYNKLNKVEPMQRALSELNIRTWFSGLRRDQSNSRANLPILSIQKNIFKFLPVIDWSNKDVHYYLQDNNLPYHPLREEGYLSLGDVHTTRKWEEGMSEEETRFFGLKRECGLHEESEAFGSGI